MKQNEWQDKFKNNLIEVMRDRGFSQNRLARVSGLSSSRINDYVNGRAVPTVYAVTNIAYALGTTPGKLIDFNERIHK